MSTRTLHRTFSICDLLEQHMTDQARRKGERTKFKLMKSTAELLGQQAFKDIRNLDICENAGVAAGVMNSHFKDKRELLVALLRFFMEQLKQEFNRHNDEYGEEEDVYIRLFDTIYYIMCCVQTNLGLWRLLLKEFDEHPTLAELYHEGVDYWSGYLSKQIPENHCGKKVTKKDKKLMAMLLGGMLDDALRFYFFSESVISDYPVEKLAETIATLRYSAIFGEFPKPASIKKANLMAKRIF